MRAKLVVAVDIGATKTLLTVRSATELAAGWETSEPVLRTETSADPAELVEWIVDAVEHSPLQPEGQVAAIGVAAPGPLDADTGVVTRSSNLGWQDVPLAPMLSRRLGAPAALEDDANSAALGEWRFGAGHGADPFAYVTVSSGIGGGVIVAGDIVRGSGAAQCVGNSRRVRCVRHHVEVLISHPPHDDVVEHRCISRIEQMGVLSPSRGDPPEIVRQRPLQSVECARTLDAKGSEVRHVEHHRVATTCPMLVEGARCIAQGHVPPPERGHLGSERPVPIVER